MPSHIHVNVHIFFNKLLYIYIHTDTFPHGHVKGCIFVLKHIPAFIHTETLAGTLSSFSLHTYILKYLHI